MKEITKNTSCQSCLMPFTKDRGSREDDRYCSLCFKNGQLCYQGNSLQEFQNICYANMRKSGIPFLLAKFYAWMIRFAPRWKNKTH